MNDDFPILAAVAANPTHPYALLEHLQSCGLPVTRSTLYRRVEALVAQGWLDADDIRGESGHYRRALTLSKQGRDRVTAEARDVVDSEALESPVFSLAVAVLGQGGVQVLAKALKPRMSAAARQLTSEERTLRTNSAEDWSVAAKERRIAHLQADLSWLQGLMGRRLVVTGRTDQSMPRAS
ncbi:MAG: helix-turn-helix transcriptional regulator [Dehalococcoidia bacterium]